MEDISTQEAAYTARSARPTVKEVMDLTGLSFSEAGSLTGRINALEQASVKTGQPNQLRVDYNALRASEAFQQDPGAALAEVGRQLASNLGQTGSGPGEVIGGSGILQLRGDKVGGDPYLRMHLVNPDSGVVETQTGLTPDATMEMIRNRGYQLSQADIDNLRQQTLDFYGGNAEGTRGQQLLGTLGALQPIEYDRPDIGNVLMSRGNRGPGEQQQYGYSYLGQDPVPYVSMDEYFSGQQATPAEELMSSTITAGESLMDTSYESLPDAGSQYYQRPTLPLNPYFGGS